MQTKQPNNNDFELMIGLLEALAVFKEVWTLTASGELRSKDKTLTLEQSARKYIADMKSKRNKDVK